MKDEFSHIMNGLNILDKTIVVGCSAGPDSMALLSFLFDNTHYNIVCAHVNHHVRRESDMEEEYLQDYCLLHGIIFEKGDIWEYSEHNFENEARKKRYAFYEEVLEKYDSHYLFLAHHGDDLMETVLMKMVRGSNLMGYAGMKKMSKWKNFFIVRPFLELTKEDLLKYNVEKNIRYFVDKTNDDIRYTRNRFRKKVIPLLKDEDTNVHKKFWNYSVMLNEYDGFVKDMVSKTLDRVYHDGYIDIEEMKKEHPFLIKNLVFGILNDLYDNRDNIVKMKHTQEILKMLDSEKPNVMLCLPNGYLAVKKYDRIYIEKKIERDYEYRLPLRDYQMIGNHVIKKVISSDSNGNDICRINSKRMVMPLWIRNKRDGDAIEVLGLHGTKKVKEIFMEKKIGLEERKSYPIVVDSKDRIIWIPNLKKSKFNTKNKEKCDIILKYCEKEENNE